MLLLFRELGTESGRLSPAGTRYAKALVSPSMLTATLKENRNDYSRNQGSVLC